MARSDPRCLDSHPPTEQVEVSDVLAEPASPRSLDQVWLHSVLGFEKARVCTYQVLSLLLAVPFAFLCGVFLAALACLHVWYRSSDTSPVRGGPGFRPAESAQV